jgi:3-hydroxyacyl-CoA dehydrogenase/enoyl-CoA hydratase/3-hydroxybutyryl-CoA epimerase
MVNELDRPGKQKLAGFYSYDENGRRQLWDELPRYFPQNAREAFDRREISERLLFAQVIEALWCRQEGVIQSNQAANLGSVHGWGFPACHGGVIQYMHSYGLEAFLNRCQNLREQYGQRFRPPRQTRALLV